MPFLCPDEQFALHYQVFLSTCCTGCVILPGDRVAACDVSNSSCQEGHDNPREERVLHFTGRERGECVHRQAGCSEFTSMLFCSRFISLEVFNILTETQDPVIAAQDPTGCEWLFCNSFRIILLSFYPAQMFLFTSRFVTFFVYLRHRMS